MKITITLLSIIIILLVIFFNQKITALQNENTPTSQGYPAKVAVTQIAPKPAEKTNYKELESLNAQLIEAKNKIQTLEQKIGLNSVKTFVLKDEMQQNTQAKQAIKTLKNTVDETKKSLTKTTRKLNKTTDDFNKAKAALISKADHKKLQELKSIVKVFQKKNKEIIQNNIERITTLKEASGGILITGAIIPIIGAATLIAYATQEIGNYCQNIKDNIALEKQLFGKVLSLDEKTKENYQAQCQTDFK